MEIKLGLLIGLLVLLIWCVRWIYLRGKEAGQRELKHRVESWIKEYQDRVADHLYHPRPDDFGEVQEPDARWEEPR